MKEETRQAPTTWYVCEICGTESPQKSFVEACELRHKRAACEHLYKIVADTEGWDNREAVSRECSKCGIVAETKTIEADKLSPELLERIFNELEE